MNKLVLFLTFISSSAFADRASLSCAPLLSRSKVLQGIALQNLEGNQESKASWQEAYLNLLNLVLEGIDEIDNHAFGHGDRVQVKSLLLKKLSSSPTPINPLSELDSDVTNDPARPATPRNLTRFSPKLSTLAESGQFEIITENLNDDDWTYIRQTLRQKLAELKTTDKAQEKARPKTREDFIDVPDFNGDNELHRLIRAQEFAEALQFFKSQRLPTRYVNHVNNLNQTPLDILYQQMNDNSIKPSGEDLHRALIQVVVLAKGLTHGELLAFTNLLKSAAKKNEADTIQDHYDIGAQIFLDDSTLTSTNQFWRTYGNSQIDADTPLHIAIVHGHIKSIRRLIKLGANVNAIGNFGDTPLILAIKHNSSPTIINALLAGRPNLEAVNLRIFSARPLGFETQTTAFLWAATMGRTDIMKRLASLGAKSDQVDLEGANAMHRLAWSNHARATNEFRSALKFLLELNLSYLINKPDNDGDYPLHYAIRAQNVSYVKALLKLGANPSVKGSETTPYELALTLRPSRAKDTILSTLKNAKAF